MLHCGRLHAAVQICRNCITIVIVFSRFIGASREALTKTCRKSATELCAPRVQRTRQCLAPTGLRTVVGAGLKPAPTCRSDRDALSIECEAAVLDHGAPARQLALHERGELLRRAGGDADAGAFELISNHGVGVNGEDLAV